ncbi:uncharacterized protein LOC128238477 [Mya arenaria]|uniref:uncharacterized protein LOC128238477 n=1 Tax=Mya arenaria TaxID=6604 RepID=UPI0022E04BB7|nr:uncharacterized protein LOC128238477 [Mya arenaria]
MYGKLPYKTVQPGVCKNNSFRKPKPWWNDELSDMFNLVHAAEKKWMQCQNRFTKTLLKHDYCSIREQFDKKVQKCKRAHWHKTQSDLLFDLEDDQKEFWKKISKIGIVSDRNNSIPMHVVLEDGSVSDDVKTVLIKWQKDFSKLLNVEHDVHMNETNMGNVPNAVNFDLDVGISINEIVKAVGNAKQCKAAGVDCIPSETLKNETAIIVLHSLFNVCFHTGIIPKLWSRSIINPIPKSSCKNPNDPLSYRGITLAPSMYKMYTSILNERIVKWTDDNDQIADEQNGFRKKRSTIDHISSLTNLVDTRKKNKQCTFCAFIDFSKAFDSVNRNLLWKIFGKYWHDNQNAFSSEIPVSRYFILCPNQWPLYRMV